ncbi:MAG: lipid-binding SYLF domain-containing protein [Phycisphaerae bacterium]|nr:lipid-binding SYLF domain-containing protein [Phycisphaerae bacterium]MDW8262735.1 lipid-binding SYLF domain-containing protein [Phycisphaerales bacterium]
MKLGFSLATVVAMLLLGCNTAPRDEAKRAELASNVQNTLAAMRADDPSFDEFLKKSYGYAVFPTVGRAGLGIGGAYGRGEVWEQGKMIGFADITQATIGLQAGGQAFSQVLAFENKDALDRFINNSYQPTAQATAVALKSGAAANAKYTDGVAIFTHVKGGLMAEAAIGGQRFRFTPLR